jgi:hypothetical protein
MSSHGIDFPPEPRKKPEAANDNESQVAEYAVAPEDGPVDAWDASRFDSPAEARAKLKEVVGRIEAPAEELGPPSPGREAGDAYGRIATLMRETRGKDAVKRGYETTDAEFLRTAKQEEAMLVAEKAYFDALRKDVAEKGGVAAVKERLARTSLGKAFGAKPDDVAAGDLRDWKSSDLEKLKRSWLEARGAYYTAKAGRAEERTAAKLAGLDPEGRRAKRIRGEGEDLRGRRISKLSLEERYQRAVARRDAVFGAREAELRIREQALLERSGASGALVRGMDKLGKAFASMSPEARIVLFSTAAATAGFLTGGAAAAAMLGGVSLSSQLARKFLAENPRAPKAARLPLQFLTMAIALPGYVGAKGVEAGHRAAGTERRAAGVLAAAGTGRKLDAGDIGEADAAIERAKGTKGRIQTQRSVAGAAAGFAAGHFGLTPLQLAEHIIAGDPILDTAQAAEAHAGAHENDSLTVHAHKGLGYENMVKQLHEKLAHEYPDPSKAPPALREFIAVPSKDIGAYAHRMWLSDSHAPHGAISERATLTLTPQGHFLFEDHPGGVAHHGTVQEHAQHHPHRPETRAGQDAREHEATARLNREEYARVHAQNEASRSWLDRFLGPRSAAPAHHETDAAAPAAGTLVNHLGVEVRPAELHVYHRPDGSLAAYGPKEGTFEGRRLSLDEFAQEAAERLRAPVFVDKSIDLAPGVKSYQAAEFAPADAANGGPAPFLIVRERAAVPDPESFDRIAL